jgi:hypothetical protein
MPQTARWPYPSGGRSERRAGGQADLPPACEVEMRSHWYAVVPSIIECHAIRFWEQRIDLKSTGHRSRQPRAPVSFHLGSATIASSLAAFNGRRGIIKI